MRADSSIQFAPVQVPPVPPREPGWLARFFEWLGELIAPLGRLFGSSWSVVKWVMLALIVAGLLYLLWQMIAPMLDLGSRRRKHGEEEGEDWIPVRAEALALLEDADRLAAEGRYDEAAHLLLKRSVHQIASARPDWVEPSSTARELAALPALPEAARTAFSAIATRVERSLFALRSLGADDWEAARAAYAEFALQRLPATA